ncbi:MAG: hypothetical protein ACKOQY_01515, partial [Bacteroidota bacterium]
TGIAWTESFMVRTSILHMRQGGSRTWQFSVSPEWLFSNGTGFGGSIVYRAQDAIALAALVRWNRYGLGLSYDINTSGIQGGPGSVEVVLSYRPAAKPRPVKRMLTSQEQPPVQEAKTAVVPQDETKAVPMLTQNTTIAPVDPVPVTSPVAPFTQLPHNSRTDEELQAMILRPAPQIHTSAEPTPEGRSVAIVAALPISHLEESTENPNKSSTLVSPVRAEESLREGFEMIPLAMRHFGAGDPVQTESQIHAEPGSNTTPVAPWTLPVQHNDGELLHPMSLLPPNSVDASVIDPEPMKSVIQNLNMIDILVLRDQEEMEQIPVRMEFDLPPAQVIQPEPVSIAVMNTSVTQPLELDESQPLHHTQHLDESILVPFNAGSLRVHGLSKLDIIEPALDRVLDNPGLSIELSGVSSSGQLNAERAVIVRQILVSKGLDPGRVRIVNHETSGDDRREAVRLNIFVNR